MFETIIAAFEHRYDLSLIGQLGAGRDGVVLLSSNTTAVKFCKAERDFVRERRVYEALKNLGLNKIAGHNVPALIRVDEELLTIEMSVVRPPFLLDFVSAYPVAEAPSFDPETWKEWRQEKEEEFGPLWPQVQKVLVAFQLRTGFVLLDIHSGNIRFAEGEVT